MNRIIKKLFSSGLVLMFVFSCNNEKSGQSTQQNTHHLFIVDPGYTAPLTETSMSESCKMDTDCYLVNTTTGTGHVCCPNEVDFSQNVWIAANVNSTKYPQNAPHKVCTIKCLMNEVPSSYKQIAKCINSICTKVPGAS